jgi:GNAT superfamily N-acetyltransferase
MVCAAMATEIQHLSGYRLTDDPGAFDLARAHAWIDGESYWGQGTPLETLRRAVENSLTVGVFAPDGAMAGMARAVTDRATYAWIDDVFVDQAHRGRGLGKAIMAYLISHPDLTGLKRLQLATRDAHGLYAQFGFAPPAKVRSLMELRGPAG